MDLCKRAEGYETHDPERAAMFFNAGAQFVLADAIEKLTLEVRFLGTRPGGGPGGGS